jgi:type IV pilus assembly protein PilY1
MNQDPRTGAKGTLLDSLYSMYGSGNTPLRNAYDHSARYLACDTNNYFGTCPALSAAAGGTCQQNVALAMTDGFYNGSYGNPYGNTDGDDDSLWDSGTSGPYGDNASATLADIAMEFYETDIHPGLANELNPPPESIDQNTAQHVTTYSVAFGVEGNVTGMPANDTDPFAWPATSTDAGKIDDLRHAAFNGRGNFYSAQNPTELIDGLRGALRSIQARIGSAASVAFNTGSLSTNSEIYLALFNSETWSGDLLSYDLDPLTGDVSSTQNWSAGLALTTRNLSLDPRTMLTYDGSDGIPFTWTSLTTAQKDDFMTNSSGTLDNEATGLARFAYTRGDRSCEFSSSGTCSVTNGIDTYTTKSFRERGSRLGDIVHSGPVFAGAPESNWPDVSPFPGTAGDTYAEFREDEASRPGVVYVGANDGILHAFAQSTGEELFAYVPSALYSTSASGGLHYLSDPAYAHRYQVDLTVSVADVHAKTTPSGATDWATILVGGLRGGGRGLFALDVTDPTSFSESGSAPANKVMWEFTSADDPDLGHSFSRPSIVPLEGPSNSIRWGIVVGNGYNDLGSGEAKLFILLVEAGLDGTWTSGSDYIEISTGTGDTTNRNGLSTPAVVDVDGDGLADTAYAGDLFGNMWAFDLSGSNTGNWDVAYKSGSTPEPLFTTQANQPITSTPVIVRNSDVPTSGSNAPNTLVIFGTGQYLTNSDITSTNVQSMYGVWDSGNDSLTVSDLVQQTIGTGLTSGGVLGRTLTNNAVGYGTLADGWYINLPVSGERIITSPVIRDDLVFFNSMVPDTNPCNFGGRGWLMVAKWINGGRPDEVSFDLNGDLDLDSLDQIGGEAAIGMEIVGIPTSPVNLGNRRYVSTTETIDGSSIGTTEIIDIGNLRTGRLSWEELTP